MKEVDTVFFRKTAPGGAKAWIQKAEDNVLRPVALHPVRA